ncbi:hypothetical protein PZ78_04735 [Vreelandella venusta]|nr:hypothetical protein PZ78_04735 [Halomonas hydrothermalis]
MAGRIITVIREDIMERIRPAEALHVAGSIASITGISLLAIGSVTSNVQLASIIAYAMAASIFLGVLGILVFVFRHVYSKLEVMAGRGVAVALSAVLIPMVIWIMFYFILILKSLAQYEFIWLFDQMVR